MSLNIPVWILRHQFNWFSIIKLIEDNQNKFNWYYLSSKQKPISLLEEADKKNNEDIYDQLIKLVIQPSLVLKNPDFNYIEYYLY